MNHDAVHVNLYRVSPADWGTWRLFATKAAQVNGRPEPPGNRVFSQRVDIASKPDELIHTSIDLSSALRDGLGHVVVEIEPIKQENARWRTVLLSWVQSTQIGLDIFRDGYDLHAWTTSLMTGAPLDGARIRSLPARLEGITNADGLVSMPLPVTNSSEQDILVAEWNGDVALLPESKNRWSSRTSWKTNPTKSALRWFVFDDRKLYKPSETVHVKGWIRKVSGGKTPMVGPLRGAADELTWVLRDSRNNNVAKGVAKLNAAGGFNFKVALTNTMNLGSARIEMNANTRSISGSRHTHSLQVQEFRRPEFEVKTTSSTGPHLVGGNATVAATGSYFAGGPLSDAKVHWSIRSRLSSYTPPNCSEYTFGTWTPWWESRRSNRDGSDSTALQGRTDSSGNHIISMEFEAVHPPRAATVIAEASVQDVNRQTFSSSSTLLVHPSEYYVGIKSERTFIKSGEVLKLDAILVGIDGKAIVGRRIDIKATRMEWRRKKGAWTQEAVETMRCKLLSGADAVQCKLTPKHGGQWRITADVVDDAGRKNQTQRTFWVAGGKMPASRKVAMEKLTLIPSKPEYQPGDTAELLVQSPIVPAEGLMSVRVGGILKQVRFNMTESTTTLKVPIAAEHVPDVSIKVDVVGAVARLGRDGEPVKNAPLRPAFAAGQIKLRVPPYRQTLKVVVEPSAEKVAPGGGVSVDVRVLRSDGQPVPNAEVALVMVDEAVLALTRYRIPDPISMFYRRRGYIGRDAYSRSSILLVDPDALLKVPAAQKPGYRAKSRRKLMSSGSLPQPAAAMQEAMMDDAETGADAGSPIGVRKNFDALAAFSPALRTDKDGRVRLPVDLP
ncbi:MAG: MG2 domain-containing protein, partial [Myxococcota bacterium]|nr:MG2 domain-containing protein [Myxococcota bacterium]